jgi:pimeloyl-ACP methyl ester carboxylesterase
MTIELLPQVTLREVNLHGHKVTYREVGEQNAGPVVLMLHGIGSSSATWTSVLPLLGRHLHVIAPDMLGYGESAKPRGDYSLGAFASGMRDLLVALGHDKATIIGHSLGGGVAMQFSYQFPERTGRLALVGSGGLGREVSPVLRAATLPGTELVLPLLGTAPLHFLADVVAKVLTTAPFVSGRSAEEFARGIDSFADVEARGAFVQTARAVMDLRGQRVSGTDRLYLAANLPLLLVAGRRDRFIPVEHTLAAAELVPDARLEIFDACGHFPHVEEPHRFSRLVLEWVEQTEDAELGPESLRELLVEAR